MTSFKISDGSKLTGNPIQTIITDLPQDDKLDENIYVFSTPEQSPIYEEKTKLWHNRCDNKNNS